MQEGFWMALLQAFIDDSSAEAGDKRLFFAGYLHNTETWIEFSKDWQAELRSSPSIAYFKASEANHLTGEFNFAKGWNTELRDRKVNNLISIIRRYAPLSFDFSINRQVVREELKPVSPYGLSQPHFLLCYAVTAGLSQFVLQRGATIPIEFVFDEQQGIDGDISTFFSHLIKSLPIEAQNLIDGNPLFKNDKDPHYLPLQAADLLAWHVRRDYETGVGSSRTRLLLNQEGHITQHLPDEMVRSWANQIREIPGAQALLSRGRWRTLRKEVRRLQEAGIDPSKIRGPGIYYPEGTPLWRRVADKIVQFIRRT